MLTEKASIVIVALIVIVAGGVVVNNASNHDISELEDGPLKISETDIGGNRLFPRPGIDKAGLDFDVNNYATEDMWITYVAKGDHLNCIMEATDASAGFLVQDTRTPPSAASRWSGDLKRAKTNLVSPHTLTSQLEELSRWGWHESEYDKGWECDFERMRLAKVFKGLGLNAKPKYEDDGDPAGGDNDCFSITHFDKNDSKEDEDENEDEFPQMKPVYEQKYNVNGNEYTVSYYSRTSVTQTY
jgi:hypothetical protein